MEEIVFLVELTDGAYMAKAVGASIVTQAESIDKLRHAVSEAVCCHFDDESKRPRLIKLKSAEEETFSADIRFDVG